jgi:hypothetical protein
MWESVDDFSRQQVYETASAAVTASPADPQLLWRYARAAYDLAAEPSLCSSRKKELLLESLAAIQKAKASGTRSHHIFRWSGLILAEIGQYVGPTEYIRNAFTVRDDWIRATQLDPSDSTAWHLLGRWHYDVACVPWVARKAASAMFTELPEGTFQQAKVYFERAEAAHPRFWNANQVMIAHTLFQLGDQEGAKRWAVSALNIPVHSVDDAKAHEDAAKFLVALDFNTYAAWKQTETAKQLEEIQHAHARARQL